MRRYFKTIISNPVFYGSTVMVVGSNITNFINYLYHLIMGRLLGPASYGELATLISILGLISMIPLSLGLVIIKFVSSAKTENEIENLIGYFNKRVVLLGLILSILIFSTSFYLAHFLNIRNPLLLSILGTTFVFSLPAFFYKSVMQGLLRFNQMVISTIGETLTKLVLAILAIFLGLSILGVVLALVVASLLSLLLALYFTRDLRSKARKAGFKINSLVFYSMPVLIQSLAMTSLYSTDLILVKHFFSAYDSGLYAALSNLGRIIFFGAGPISAVMFPMIAQRQAKGEDYRKIFISSLSLTLLFSIGILSIYLLVPNLAIKTLYGSAYLGAASLLIWFGLFMTLFTISSLLLSFYLSLGKTKIVALPLIAAVLQIILIWINHPSLISVIFISIIVSLLLLISLSFYSLRIKA